MLNLYIFLRFDEFEEEQEYEGIFSTSGTLSSRSIEMQESPDYVGVMQLKGKEQYSPVDYGLVHDYQFVA